MNNEEKSKEIANNLITAQVQDDWWYPRAQQHYEEALMEMAQWKDEQLESKLMQIIILAQQGYTSGATDEMILRQCKEIINENYEHNTTTTD